MTSALPPASVSSAASEPSRSSASSVSLSATVQPKRSKKRRASANCGARSSGTSGRVGVVAVVELHAVVGGVRAEAEHDGARLVLLDLAQHQVRGAEQGVDGLAVRALDGVGQRVEGAEQHRGGVDDEQGTGHAGDSGDV